MENLNGTVVVENVLGVVGSRCLVADMNIAGQDREYLADGNRYLGHSMVDYMSDPVQH